MNNYYRFSISGFANCDKVVAVDVNSELDKEHLKRLYDYINDINDAWIDRYSLLDVQNLFAYRNRCRREGVGDNPIGATSITPIADVVINRLLTCQVSRYVI